MATPAEIQAQVNRLRNDTNALRNYLQGLSAQDYAAWARSPERTNAVGAGAAETLGIPALAAAAPYLGALTLTGAGISPTLGTAAPTGAGVLAGFGAVGAGASQPRGQTTTTKSQAVTELENLFRMSFDPQTRSAIDAAVAAGLAGEGLVAAVAQRLGVPVPNPVAEAAAMLAGVTASRPGDGNTGLLEELLAAGYRPLPGNPNIFVDPTTGNSIDISTGRSPTSGGGAASPTPRFSFQEFGGQVYRANDLTGDLTPTGVTVPGFSKTFTDRNGNLVGIDLNGQYQLIQSGFSFPEIDPERAQRLEEAGTTGFFGGLPTLAREEMNERARAADQVAAVTARGQNFQLAPQLGQLAVQQNEFVRDVLRNPSDWMSRAAMQRGEASPQPFVSQADILNRLRSDLENINSFFSQMQQPPRRPATGETVWVDPARPVAPEVARAPQVVPQAAPAPIPATAGTPVGNVGMAAPTTTTPTRIWPDYGEPPRVPSQKTWAESGEPARPPATPSFNFPRPATQAPQTIASVPMDQRQLLRMEKGGHGFNMVITGDSSDGKPNEELVIDLPGDAGMAVIPMDDIKGAPKKKKGGKVPYAQDGGLFSFDMQPRIPTIPAFDQNNLRQIARENVAPAVRDVFAGQRPSPLRFEFALPTIGQTSSLTRAEREAADPYLATLYNTTMADVEDAQRFFFGPTQSRPQAVRVR